MKTSEFIAVLTSADAAPVRLARPFRPLILFSLVGALLALAMLASWLGIQPLTAAVHANWFWMKAGYSLSLAAAGLLLLSGLARPGASTTSGRSSAPIPPSTRPSSTPSCPACRARRRCK